MKIPLVNHFKLYEKFKKMKMCIKYQGGRIEGVLFNLLSSQQKNVLQQREENSEQ
jgi:hypothetical protein